MVKPTPTEETVVSKSQNQTASVEPTSSPETGSKVERELKFKVDDCLFEGYCAQVDGYPE